MKKILVVDDSKIIRGKFVEYLKSAGYEAVTADNGKEALEIVQKEPFDLILMDLMMPVMDGFEAIRRIRKIKSLPFIPIIVISGLETPDDLKKALKLGANEYVFKPIDEIAFDSRVEAMLNLKDLYEKKETSERKYETLLQSLPDVVYKLDLEGNFVFISDSVKKLGFEPQEIIGRHFSEIIHPDDVPFVSRSMVLSKYAGKNTGDENAPKLFDERRSKNRATQNLEFRLIPKDPGAGKDDSPGINVMVTVAFGEVVSAGQYNPESKETLGTVGVIRDITERKQAEEERRNFEAQIQYAQKLDSLGLMAGSIAHDFNNILMGILGNAEFIMDDISPKSPHYSCVKAIDISAKRAAELSNQMLTYAGKTIFNIESCNLNDIVKGTIPLVQSAISKDIILKHNLDNNIPNIEADATQIRQVIMNLIINASEAVSDNKGFIFISTGVLKCVDQGLRNIIFKEAPCEGVCVYLEVTDTGMGMDKETIDKIFDPFFSTKFIGRGLGMAAVQGIMRSHKGSIKVSSKPGKGTTLSVYFNAVDQPTTPEVKKAITAEDWRGSGIILLVDDEENIRDVVKLMLSKLGFTVLTANGGKEALKMFSKHSDEIVLVLLDFIMPHMGGKECFYELQKIRKDIRIVISSGYSEEEIAKSFVSQDVNEFIQKPFRLETLRNKLHKVLCKDSV